MAPTVQIRLFGGFSASVGDEQVAEGAWRLRKAKSLVKLLALAPERRVHRERATEWLWPDRAPEAAANNFHQALYVARRAFDAAGADGPAVLPLQDDMLLLYPGGDVEVDVDAFEAAAARARDTREPADYRAALALHGGELLPEDRYELWARGRHEALSETYLTLLLDHSARLADAGDAAGAIEAAERAVVADPLHEAAHRDLMRLFAADGRRQQALAQYHQLRDALRRDLAADPDPQTGRLYRALLRGDPDPDPPAREPPRPRVRGPRSPPAERARHNLPIPLTSFVGRGRELGDIARLLDRDRLVTLTGAGGAGKTRLALEAARARVDACPDGVWLIELAGLSDPALVPHAAAAALGLTLPARRLDLEGLGVQLASWNALLVLDNCEHLVGACAALAHQLLATAPGLRVLATSREPLRAPGEVTWRVPSMVLPTPSCADPGQLREFESVRLFCERAADAMPGFALTASNAAAVGQICIRLDGMPLALELAAARAGALSAEQIAERLGDSLALLTAGRRSALDRQQTLRATLNWSHDLLDADEREQFRRLAVFAGGFGLDGAEAVAGADDGGGTAVADLLGRLVDKSLVVADDGAGGYRYRLLEPMRQYAFERLVDAGEAPELESRHLDFYLAYARSVDPECAYDGPTTHPDRLEADHDNVRAGLAWGLRTDPGKALSLAVHTWPMWMAASHFKEGRRWFDAALAAAPAPTGDRAEALRAAAGLEIRLGRSSGIGRLGAERVEIFRRLGDRQGEAHALDEAGIYEYMVGRYDEADALYAQSLVLGEELGDRKVMAAVLHSRGVLAQCRGEFDHAREQLLAGLTQLREVPGDDAEAFFRVHADGLFVAREGPGGPPRLYFEETLQFFRRVDALRAIGYVLAALGDVARSQGLAVPARERLGESLALFRDVSDPMGTAFALNRLGNLAAAQGEHDLARELLEEGLALRRDLGDRREIGMTLANLGVAAARAGDSGRGKSLVSEALALFEETDDMPGQMGMRLGLGNIAAAAGEHDSARELLEAARTMALRQRLIRAAGWTELTLAELAIGAGDRQRAAGLADTALRRFRELGDRWGLARAAELDEAAAKPSLSAPGQG